MLPYGMAQAETYTETIHGKQDKYDTIYNSDSEQIRIQGTQEGEYIYNFGDNALLNTEGVGINAFDKIIKIDNKLDITSGGEAVLIYNSQTDTVVDRRYGGEINSTDDQSAISILGNGNKIYLGSGNINFTQTGDGYNKGSVLGIQNSKDNMIVYGEGTLQGERLNHESSFGLTGVLIDGSLGNNKIILGYKDYVNNYDNGYFDKFDNSTDYKDLVNSLGNVAINIDHYAGEEEKYGSMAMGLQINTNQQNNEVGKI